MAIPSLLFLKFKNKLSAQLWVTRQLSFHFVRFMKQQYSQIFLNYMKWSKSIMKIATYKAFHVQPVLSSLVICNRKSSEWKSVHMKIVFELFEVLLSKIDIWDLKSFKFLNWNSNLHISELSVKRCSKSLPQD